MDSSVLHLQESQISAVNVDMHVQQKHLRRFLSCCAAFRERWDINHGQHSAEFVLNGFQLTCEISEGSSCVCSAAETTENKVLNCCGF